MTNNNFIYLSRNWLVKKDGELLFVSHKTGLQNVIDKLIPNTDSIYEILDVTEKFIKVESINPITEQGILHLKFDVNRECYLEDRYGNVKFENGIYSINKTDEQLLKRIKSKLSQQEIDALIKRLME